MRLWGLEVRDLGLAGLSTSVALANGDLKGPGSAGEAAGLAFRSTSPVGFFVRVKAQQTRQHLSWYTFDFDLYMFT